MIREAEEKDYEPCCKLSKENRFISSFPCMSFRWGWKGKLFVAEEEGKILGFAFFNVCKRVDRSTLYFIYVQPGARGKGLGRKLFELYIEKSGSKRLSWKVDRRNTEALGFYEKQGFKPAEQDTRDFKFSGVQSELR